MGCQAIRHPCFSLIQNCVMRALGHFFSLVDSCRVLRVMVEHAFAIALFSKTNDFLPFIQMARVMSISITAIFV